MRGGLETSWNGDINVATLNPQPVFPELYYPIWLYSGSYDSLHNNTAGNVFFGKGSTSSLNISSGSLINLFTVNTGASSLQKYAFEIAIQAQSGYTANAELWDITSNSSVSGSSVSTTSTTFTVIRSGQFTLTPSHTYGITLWDTGIQTNATDASLIIFPQAPLASPSVSSISLANPSGNTLKEAYIPLWVYSSGKSAGLSSQLTAGTYFLQKGSTNPGASPATSSMKLYTLGIGWSASQKFAFEASFQTSASATTAYLGLYDFTSSQLVSASQLSTASTTMTLFRSGTFTLVPSHVYGVTLWLSDSSSNTITVSKAHLVALAP